MPSISKMSSSFPVYLRCITPLTHVVPGATAPIKIYAPFEHILQLFPSVPHLICPEVHPLEPEFPEFPELLDVVAAGELGVVTFGVVAGVVDVVGVVGSGDVGVVVAGSKFAAQTMAPLTRLVAEETAPMLTYTELTQTDQLRPSGEH